MENHTISQWIGNIAGVGAIITTMLGVLPAVAALVAFVWYLIQIWESKTVKDIRDRRKIEKLARLKAKVLVMESRIAKLPAGYDKL